jgi:hypothetical protein
MRAVVAALAAVWALGNLLVAYLFASNAFGSFATHRGEQLLLLSAGLLLGVFALGVLWQSGRAVVTRPPSDY